MQHTQSPLEISDDKGRLDVPLIHRFLSEEAYWSLGIPLSTVQRAINHSLCFGGYVFVLPAHRGRGHSKALMTAIVDHPALQGLRRLMLATSDAQGLYAGFGFAPPRAPGSLMEKYDPEIYRRP